MSTHSASTKIERSVRWTGLLLGATISSFGVWHMITEHLYVRSRYNPLHPTSVEGSIAFAFGWFIFSLGMQVFSMAMPTRRWALRWLTISSMAMIFSLVYLLRQIYR